VVQKTALSPDTVNGPARDALQADLGPAVQVDPVHGEKLLAWTSPQSRPCPPENPRCTPGSNTIGLAWDGSAFWASDRTATDSGIYRRDPDTGVWERQFMWTGPYLGPITLDGSALWVVDESLGAIFRIDMTSGRTLGRVAIPPTALWKPPAVTGVTWDGKALWLATACGLCSSFYRIDPNTSEVLQSLFPKCEPRGLAFDGAFLWTIGSNGPTKPPRLSRRRPALDPASIVSSHRLLNFTPVGGGPFPSDPTALAVPHVSAGDAEHGANLFVVDRATGIILQVVADRREQPAVRAARTPVRKAPD
jgi:hypothetical protein